MPSKAAKPVVLVVDDMFDARMLMKITLERSGWLVLEASDALEAINTAHEHQPDVILMDYNMPDKTGVEACADLKQHPNTSQIPIIIYTGVGLLETKQQALDAGAVLFLRKPILPKDLVEHINRIYQEAYN